MEIYGEVIAEDEPIDKLVWPIACEWSRRTTG